MTYQYWLGGTTIGAGGCVLLANRASKGTAETAHIKVEANSNTSQSMFITAAGNHEVEAAATCRGPAMTRKEEIKRSDERNSQKRLIQGARMGGRGGKETSKFQRCVQSGYWAARRTKG